MFHVASCCLYVNIQPLFLIEKLRVDMHSPVCWHELCILHYMSTYRRMHVNMHLKFQHACQKKVHINIQKNTCQHTGECMSTYKKMHVNMHFFPNMHVKEKLHDNMQKLHVNMHFFPNTDDPLLEWKKCDEQRCAPSLRAWRPVFWRFLQLQPLLSVSSPLRVMRWLRSARDSLAITWKQLSTYTRCGPKLVSWRLARSSRRFRCLSLKTCFRVISSPSLLLPLPFPLTIPLPPLPLSLSLSPETTPLPRSLSLSLDPPLNDS